MNLQEILNKWNIKCDINTLLTMWNESHRHYHTQSHLNDLIEQINENKISFTEKEYEKLILTALFHDCIYEVTNVDNEEKSAEFFLECCVDKSNRDIQDIKNYIIDTKNHYPTSRLSKIFIDMDMDIVNRSYESLLEWENGIYNEYKIFGDDKYKEGRVKFLESMLDKHFNNTDNLLKLLEYVNNTY